MLDADTSSLCNSIDLPFTVITGLFLWWRKASIVPFVSVNRAHLFYMEVLVVKSLTGTVYFSSVLMSPVDG